jgi:hypothetical protein
MGSVELLAFDGAPLIGAAGIRTAMLRRGDHLIASGRSPINMAEFDRLVGSGHVTRLRSPLAVPDTDGVVLYRHADFSLLDVDTLGWQEDDGFCVVYYDLASATRWLLRSAELAYSVASTALMEGSFESARRTARLGLMLSSQLASSGTAARLYGILLALPEGYGGERPMREEIAAMLDEPHQRDALVTAALLGGEVA